MAATAPQTESLALSPSPGQRLRAMYIWGHEVNSLQLCGESASYWASFNWAGQEMHEYYRANAQQPYQPMYLEFRGVLLDEQRDGFAADYDGLLHISEVYRYDFELPTDCGV